MGKKKNNKNKKNTGNTGASRTAERGKDAGTVQGAENMQDTGNMQDAGTVQSEENTQGAGNMQDAGTVQSEENTQGAENAKKPEKQKDGRGRGRTMLGIAIILMGVCVCLYPFYRQKKSDDFNEDAINMILTPQPTKAEAAGPTEVTDIPQMTGTGQALPNEPAVSTEPDMALLGGDLLENPDAPDVQEPDEDGKENANRLGGKTVIGVIQIPKIELIYAIVEGSDAAEIGVAIGHMSSTAGLGEIGNCALAGHRGGYSGPYFKNLDKLEIGDEVIITNAKQKVFTYKVTETMVVQPDEVWVIEDTGEEVAMLTLVTCESNGEERLIVRCVLEE